MNEAHVECVGEPITAPNICGLASLPEWNIHPPAVVGEFSSFGDLARTPVSEDMKPSNSDARWRFLGGVAVGVLLGIGACWGFGMFASHYHPVEESKLCYNALTNHPENLQPQMREYLKARYYWNAAVWVSPSWQVGWQTDFGPVDDSLLAGLDPYKDASTSSEVYQEALRKHRLLPKSK